MTTATTRAAPAGSASAERMVERGEAVSRFAHRHGGGGEFPEVISRPILTEMLSLLPLSPLLPKGRLMHALLTKASTIARAGHRCGD